MVVLPDGRTVDTIGGGKVELQAIDDALDSLRRGISRIASYELRQTGDNHVVACHLYDGPHLRFGEESEATS